MRDEKLRTKFVRPSALVSEPSDLQSALDSDLSADVVVIGGGYAGLHTALTLRQLDYDVVLVEQEFCGFGASGRNGGNLVGPGGKELRKQMKAPSSEDAVNYVRYVERNVERAKQVISEYSIDCDFNETGTLYASPHPEMEKETRALVESCRGAGYDRLEFWDESKAREQGIPAVFRCGAFVRGGGTIHPGKYVLGLRRAVIDSAIRVFEKSPVNHIEDNRRVVVRTSTGGSVTADKAVITTGGFTPSTLGMFGDKLAAFHLGAIETEPLTDEQRASLGWPNREGVGTWHHFLEGYRLSKQNTLVCDTKRVMIPYGNRIVSDFAPGLSIPLARNFRRRFPTLRDVKIAHTWHGWCGLTPSRLPLVGQTGQYANIYYCVGFNGHGITPTAGMGYSMGKVVAGQPDPHYTYIKGKTKSWPSEPLRWLGAKTFIRWLEMKDARWDRDLVTGQIHS